MTGNATYPEPPITIVVLSESITAFSNAMASQHTGGPPATSAKNDKRDQLIRNLMELASYVQIKSGGDLTLVLNSGFRATSKERTSIPLPAPIALKVTNDGEGQLVVKVKAIKNARSYEVLYSLSDAPPGTDGQVLPFTQSRSMRITGLISGKRYVIQVRAIGGSLGTSNWSDPISHVSL